MLMVNFIQQSSSTEKTSAFLSIDIDLSLKFLICSRFLVQSYNDEKYYILIESISMSYLSYSTIEVFIRFSFETIWVSPSLTTQTGEVGLESADNGSIITGEAMFILNLLDFLYMIW